MTEVSVAAVRRLAVVAQGYATRARRARVADVEAVVERLGAVQLDSISTVDRSHRLVISARAGAMPAEDAFGLVSRGRLFEYWSHEACLLPVRDYPLSRFRMRSGGHWGSHRRALRDHPELVDVVLGVIRERGPVASREFEGRGTDDMGGMWNWKPAKAVLEALYDRGDLAIAGRRNGFQRLYDLPERVIPAEVLAQPEPSEDELLRALAVRAVRARGVLTVGGIVEHHRLPGGVARMAPHVEALVAAGELRRLSVDDGGPHVFVPGDLDLEAALDAPLPGGVLLSPFDNLLWDRAFARRILAFDHVMEIYKPAPTRVYGYYVLPFLRGDRLVGRADLKADRPAGTLRVLAFHREPGVRPSAALDAALDRTLTRLAWTLGLERVER